MTLYYISSGILSTKTQVMDKRYVSREWFCEGVRHLMKDANFQILVPFLSGYEPVWINAKEEDLVEL